MSQKFLENRSIVLGISALITLIYVIYLVSYFYGTINVSEGSEQLGGMIATAMVTPYMLFMLIGTIFLTLGFFLKKNWAALVGAILVSVAAVLFIAYIVLSLIIVILAWIGYAMQKKKSLIKV